MGVGWNSVDCVDHGLLLHLERSEMDWKSCVLHCSIPIRSFDNPVDQRNHSSRSIPWNKILPHA